MNLHTEMMHAHKHLHEELHELQQTISGECDADTIRTALEATKPAILEHFQFEEKDGYMDVVLDEKPYVYRSVEELRDDHRELANELERLLNQTKSANVVELRGAVQTWIVRIREHETRENLFVMEHLDRDVEARD